MRNDLFLEQLEQQAESPVQTVVVNNPGLTPLLARVNVVYVPDPASYKFILRLRVPEGWAHPGGAIPEPGSYRTSVVLLEHEVLSAPYLASAIGCLFAGGLIAWVNGGGHELTDLVIRRHAEMEPTSVIDPNRILYIFTGKRRNTW